MSNFPFRCLFSPTASPSPVVKLIVWLCSVVFAAGLAFLRVATDAEFAFASAIILPVVAVAWFVNKRQGLAYSVLAAIVWVVADFQAGKQFSADWVPWVNGLTRFGVYALVAYLTSSLHEVLIHECELARHDPLSGLLNRRAFFEVGNSETVRAKRYGHALGIVFLDLDDFKALNDARGHEVGDMAIKAVSGALQQILRASDSAGRLGGDEFAVVLPEINFQASNDAGHKIAHAINAALKGFHPVSVSIGIAWFERVLDDFPTMLATADGVMYEVKKERIHGLRAKQFNVPTIRQGLGEAA